MEYRELVNSVRLYGHGHEARGLRTRELLGATLTHPAGHIPMRTGLNRALGYMELLQLLAGKFDVGALARVAPNAKLDLFTDQAAYGPRMYNSENDQLGDVLEELTRHPDSRRAVIYMSNPEEGFPYRPCTNSLQFLLRDGRLHTVVSMRSWDLYMGAPYDLMMFGGLNMVLADLLNVKQGNITVCAGSAHIYEEHINRVGWRIGKPTAAFYIQQWVLESLDSVRNWASEGMTDVSWVHGEPKGIVEVSL